MSLMSYCTDERECNLIEPTKIDMSEERNVMESEVIAVEETNRSNKKSKSNCSNIRK